MPEKKLVGFDVLVDLAGKFIELQKGMWDHSAWLDFLLDIQKKGFEISDDMEAFLGSMLEAMKKLYIASITTRCTQGYMEFLTKQAADFIKDTKGVWDHQKWESFVQDLKKKGFDVNEETRFYLGGVLEATKELFTTLPLMSTKGKRKPPQRGELD